MRETILARAQKAAPFELDHRGLMSLALARKILKEHPVYVPARKDDGETPDEIKAVGLAARQWAALLSLEDGDELEKALFELTWNPSAFPYDGRLLVERYGPAPMMKFFVGGLELFGMFNAPFWDTLEILKSQGTEEAFDLMLRVCNTDQRLQFKANRKQKLADVPPPKFGPVPHIDKWLLDFAAAYPEQAQAVLARRIALKDKRAKEIAKLLNPVAKKPLTPAAFEKALLAAFDKAAAGPAGDWPCFNTGIEDDPSTWEYFELRMLAVRSKTTDDWGLVFERMSGSYDRYESTRLQRYFYGSKVKDPGWDSGRDVLVKFELDQVPDQAKGTTLTVEVDGVTVVGVKGKLLLEAQKLAKRDLKPGLGCELEGDAGFNHRLRAYVDAFPGASFSQQSELLPLVGIPEAMIISDTTAFAHAVGKGGKGKWCVAPSKSQTYRSLARAIVGRDPKAFEAGTSNLDFRLHARHPLG